MTLPVEFGCQNMMRNLSMMRVKGLVPDMLIGSVQFLSCSPRSMVANVMQKPVRLQGLFNVIVRECGHEMRKMMNNFKALVVNMDKFMVIISLRWESPSGTFIRLCKYFLLIVPRVDIILSFSLTWLHLEKCDQAAHSACLMKTKQAKYFGLED